MTALLLSNGIDCAFDASGCLVCPEVPAVTPVPPHYKTEVVLGWNAGANSITQLDGDLHTVFSMPVGVTGVVVGLKSSRLNQTVPDALNYGFFFQSAAGLGIAQVTERGVPMIASQSYVDTDQFEVRRSAGVVTYWQNNTLLYTSKVMSFGPMVVNSCLFASGDAVGNS
ncbi:MAG: hypothetical protein WA777_12655 [Rhodanobacter sp.]